MEITRRKYRPSHIAKMWGCGIDKVLNLIRSGQLRAMNGCTNPHGRPRYLVDQADLEAFERMRSTVQRPEPIRQRRHEMTEGGKRWLERLQAQERQA